MDLFVDKMMVSEDIENAFFGAEESVLKACDEKATEICRQLFPTIDLTMQENVDLVIRPMSAVMVLNELLLQNFFSMSSIDGVYVSKTLPLYIKIAILKNYASLNDIAVVSSDLEGLYSEVTFFLRNNTQNRSSNLTNDMLADIPSLKKVLLADGFSPELTRNEVPYIQIDQTKLMNFKRNDLNPGQLIGHSYSRKDFQQYQEYINSDRVSIPGSLDIYFHAGIEELSISLTRSENGLYELPEGFYIGVSSDKAMAASAPDTISDGFVKFSPSVAIIDGLTNEEVTVLRYIDPAFNFEDNEMLITDIQTKGFYPLFIDLDVYTKDKSVTEELVKEKADTYLASVGWDMLNTSLNTMQIEINKAGLNAVISPKAKATLMVFVNGSVEQDVTFPLTMADLVIPAEVDSRNFTPRTISVFIRSVNVIQE